MKQRKVIWAIPPTKIEKIWNAGTIISGNSALEKEPPYPVRVVTRVRDERGRPKYNVGTLSRIADGKCEVKVYPSDVSIAVSLQPDEEIRLWPDADWFLKKMFDEDAVKIKDFAELLKGSTVIVKVRTEAGFGYRAGKVVKLTDAAAEINLNDCAVIFKCGHESKVRLWK